MDRIQEDLFREDKEEEVVQLEPVLIFDIYETPYLSSTTSNILMKSDDLIEDSNDNTVTDDFLEVSSQTDKAKKNGILRGRSVTKAIVVHVFPKHMHKTGFNKDGQRSHTRSLASRLQEALGLARSIDLDVVYSGAISYQRTNPATLIGKGSVENLTTVVQTTGATLAVFDTTLTPVQQRNLEKQLKCKVIDRTGLILEIFGRRATTKEGSLQVNLALLKHLRSRLVRAWTHLERQRGGFGFTGGPGESQIELDRRMIDTKIMKLERDLEQVKRTRNLHRKKRKREGTPVVALVGYTNAGKSTLFNHLTSSNVMSEDLLFATLDPTIRPLKLPNGRTVLLSDTVGFISDLPTQLVAAFRATLEEVQEATVILHVRDRSNDEHEAQKDDVLKVLEQLEVDYDCTFTRPAFVDVFNKTDLLPEQTQKAISNFCDRHDNTVCVSAMKGSGMQELLLAIQKALDEKTKAYALNLPENAGPLLAWCYRNGVIESRQDTDTGCHLVLKLNEVQLEYITKQIPCQNDIILI